MGIESIVGALASRRLFIVYRLVPHEGQKADKVPIDVYSGLPADPHDPRYWMLPADAVAWAQLYQQRGDPCGLGLVIAEGSGLFCIDIDGCLQPDSTWSENARNMCRRFPGAGVEISVSVTGLHILGSFKGTLPPHRTRNQQLHMECYTRSRFIALTGTAFTGDILSDHTGALMATITEFFPEKTESPASIEGWTTEPVPQWCGPSDDDQLLAIAQASRGAAAIFGGGVSFADLWTANEEALATRWPPMTAGKSWNYSSADQALANHLAYWTGSDCERMGRLMWRSELRREKWERLDYFVGTVQRAAREQRSWYHASPVPAPPTPQGAPPMPQGAPPAAAAPVPGNSTERPAPGAFLSLGDQLSMFANCTYIQDIHEILTSDGTLLTPDRFDASYGGYLFQLDHEGGAPGKRAWDCFLHSQMHHFPRARGLIFDPKSEPFTRITRDGQDFINSWKPIHVPRLRGDPEPFLTHLQKCYPYGNDAKILLAYFAFVVQYPGVKSQWAPLLQGVEGNGKTFFSFALEHCVGQRYTHHAKASQLDSRFNSAFYGKLLVTVEDVFISEAKNSMWETLKPMITSSRLEIEGKGIDKVTREVCFNLIMNTNHKDGLRKTKNDRRIASFFGAQQHEADLARCGMTEDYFIKLYQWAQGGGWAIIADYLHNYSIPDSLNPAKGCVRAPRTTSTEEAITASRGSVEQEIDEAIAEGRMGFRNGWVSSIALDRLLVEIGKSRVLPRTKRHELLEAMGYVLHPTLPNGRVLSTLPDGSKPRLYVLAQNSAVTINQVDAVTKTYLDAQAQPSSPTQH